MNIEVIRAIIDGRRIQTVFQPIVSARDGNVFGYEALTRITDEYAGMSPDTLFSSAQKHDLLRDLERVTRKEAIERACELLGERRNNVKLFLNVSPIIILDSRFMTGFTKKLIEYFKIKEQNIVFEITERNAIDNIQLFKTTINHYKSQGFKIAIDDVGAGYSGLNLISEIAPHYVKIDMKLIRNIHTDILKRGIIKGIVEFSNISNILLIAEGIESHEELETIINLGVQYGQGYFIQKPGSGIHDLDPTVLSMLSDINIRKNRCYGRGISDIYIKNICTHTYTAAPREKITDVYERYARDPDFDGLCILNGNVPVGVITREKLHRTMGGRFGFSLHGQKHLADIMDTDFLVVDERKSIDVVSGMAMARGGDKLYDFVVVTSDRRYIGIVTVKTLLLKTTEIEVSVARHQNPLSGLPGNILIEQELVKCLSALQKFSVAYIDLDNFKAYNDIYGFESGDCVLKLFAEKLKGLISESCFIGHIGGDDFIAIVHEHVTEKYFSGVLESFASEVLYFYNQEDVKNGYITATGRDNLPSRFSLLSATCVIVDNAHCSYENTTELGEQLARRKKEAKIRKGGKLDVFFRASYATEIAGVAI
jgi:EAL domain-containing protein (putative c-di-GMP-specific phosphodiesterase class I)/GGDEF domain-containing protein